jgi:glycosyltransferase involved in cell wall biosynthesis
MARRAFIKNRFICLKSPVLPRIVFTVTNDLSYDQRMIRICSSLAENGYDVLLVGRKRRSSIPLTEKTFRQKRLNCWFDRGALFYAEFNIRLFLFLLTRKADAICAIDLDTILPVLYISWLKKINRIYDAHELFCEMKEIVSRPRIYAIWKMIERHTVPAFKHGYTVNGPIAGEFRKMYGVDYAVIRSMARYEGTAPEPVRDHYILYQGAVNEGRCFETLIPAMQWVDAPLHICGDGNFMNRAKDLVRQYGLESKIIFHGLLPPEELKPITRKARIGLTLFEPGARSNYFSLANRFFDYIQAGVPQLCVDYPVYRELNNLHHVAVLINDLSARSIAGSLNQILQNEQEWTTMKDHCISAAKELNWQSEEKKLLSFYRKLIG